MEPVKISQLISTPEERKALSEPVPSEEIPWDRKLNYCKGLFKQRAESLASFENKSGRYDIDGENQEVITQVLMYAIGHPDCRYDHRKGLCLVGNVGSGKSMLLRVCRDIRALNLRIKDCKVLSDEYQQRGFEAMLPYTRFATGVKHEYVFDDLGTERKKANHFGNDSNVMAEVIAQAYNNFIDHKTRTHFTHNLTRDEIETTYGDRTLSRFIQMTNWVVLGEGENSTDRRKKHNL